MENCKRLLILEDTEKRLKLCRSWKSFCPDKSLETIIVEYYEWYESETGFKVDISQKYYKVCNLPETEVRDNNGVVILTLPSKQRFTNWKNFIVSQFIVGMTFDQLFSYYIEDTLISLPIVNSGYILPDYTEAEINAALQ